MKDIFLFATVLLYIFFSAFLETEEGGRLVLGDLIVLILIMVSAILAIRRNSLMVPRVYMAALPLFFVFAFSSIFALYPERSAFELVVMLFSFVGSLSIFNLLIFMNEEWLKRLIKGYVLVIGGISLICLIDFFVMPGLISTRQLGGVQGPFRNTGQAGSFFGVHGVIVLSLLLSNVVPRRLVYNLCFAMIAFAMLFTLKRASILSFVSGIVFLNIFLMLSSSTKDKKIGITLMFLLSFLSLSGYMIFQWAILNVNGMSWRFNSKYSSETLSGIADEGSFFLENIRSSFAAFQDSPLFGVGLDNVREVYQSHEIHSTYLGILAYGGFFGIFSYIYFITNLFIQVFKAGRYKIQNEWSAFLYFLLPLLLGQMIGWAYTIHIRKREFWVLMFLAAVAIALVKRSRSARGVSPDRPLYGDR